MVRPAGSIPDVSEASKPRALINSNSLNKGDTAILQFLALPQLTGRT
jgi:hypothetical protein